MIPERADQQANRKSKGRGGGRPRTLDTEIYKRRNVVERSFSLLKQWRSLAPPLRQTRGRLPLRSRAGGNHRLVTELRDTT